MTISEKQTPSLDLQVIHQTGLGEGIAIALTFGSGARDEHAASLIMLMASYVRAADTGMFAGQHIAPDAGGVDTAPDYLFDGTSHTWRLKYWRCDVCAWSVLANLLERFSQTVFVIKQLKIFTESQALLNFTMGSALPQINPGVPFHYELQVVSRTIVIEAQFAEIATPEKQQKINEYMLLWGFILMMGGFADQNIFPVNSGVLMNDEPGLDPHGLVWSLEKVACSLGAFDVLVNLFCRIHLNVLRIESLKVS